MRAESAVDIRNRVPNSGLPHIIVRSGKSVQEVTAG
jgi:hypothetical protein